MLYFFLHTHMHTPEQQTELVLAWSILLVFPSVMGNNILHTPSEQLYYKLVRLHQVTCKKERMSYTGRSTERHRSTDGERAYVNVLSN